MTSILYVTPGVFDKGGIARYGRYQIDALREIAGPDRVTVLSLLGHGVDDLETTFEVAWQAGGASTRHKVALGLRTLAAAARRPDIVWCAHVNMLPLAMRTASLARARCVLNVYGREVWSDVRRSVARAMRRVPHVVSDCHNTARYLTEKRGWRGASMTIAWDCVDLGRFCPGEPRQAALERYGLPAKRGRTAVLMLGRITHSAVYKGWRRLLDVAERVRDDDRFLFILGGDGDLRAELTDEARRRALRSVHFTGSVHEDDLVDVYRYADVCTLVSDAGPGRGEGIPLTPLEAAACGAPILVGNQDGSREAVIEGENGFILDPFDIAGHAERLQRLADPAIHARASAAARRRIVEYHSYEVFRETHRRLLAELGA